MEKKKGETVQDYGQERELLRWEAEERLAIKKSRDFYSTMMVLAILVGIVLFFIEGIMPVLVVAAILFVGYALINAEPRIVMHQITNKGIVTEGARYVWDELGNYWIDEQEGRKVLHVMTYRRWPTRLVMVLPKSGGVNENDVKGVLSEYLEWEVPTVTRIDKMVSWFNEKVPLE